MIGLSFPFNFLDPLVIIHNLYIMRPVGLPQKTDAPPIVYADAVLSLAVSAQNLQSIPRWNPQIFQSVCCLQLIQLPQRNQK
jgi:hypothetical protein